MRTKSLALLGVLSLLGGFTAHSAALDFQLPLQAHLGVSQTYDRASMPNHSDLQAEALKDLHLKIAGSCSLYAHNDSRRALEFKVSFLESQPDCRLYELADEKVRMGCFNRSGGSPTAVRCEASSSVKVLRLGSDQILAGAISSLSDEPLVPGDLVQLTMPIGEVTSFAPCGSYCIVLGATIFVRFSQHEGFRPVHRFSAAYIPRGPSATWDDTSPLDLAIPQGADRIEAYVRVDRYSYGNCYLDYDLSSCELGHQIRDTPDNDHVSNYGRNFSIDIL